MKLDTDSSYLTTFNTFLGHFCWLCRPFGVKTAPAEYQRRIDECLQNLNGIEDIENDTLCVGEGNTYKIAVQDHDIDRSLTVLVTRYRGKKIKLNPKKLQLIKQEVRCIGHLLTPDDLMPDLNIVKEILRMHTPLDKQSSKRLPGMITYL